jgi:hypothetical protein
MGKKQLVASGVYAGVPLRDGDLPVVQAVARQDDTRYIPAS